MDETASFRGRGGTRPPGETEPPHAHRDTFLLHLSEHSSHKPQQCSSEPHAPLLLTTTYIRSSSGLTRAGCHTLISRLPVYNHDTFLVDTLICKHNFMFALHPKLAAHFTTANFSKRIKPSTDRVLSLLSPFTCPHTARLLEMGGEGEGVNIIHRVTCRLLPSVPSPSLPSPITRCAG